MSSSEQSQIDDLVESLREKKNSTRRNLDSLGTIGFTDFTDADIELSDTILFFGSFLVFVIVGNLTPSTRNWAIFTFAVSGVLSGGILLGIIVSPPGMSFYGWLKCKKGFMFGEDTRSAINGDSGRITKDLASSNGERRALEDLTRVDGFAPEANGVWRFDGAIVGGVEIDPAELSLASKEDWESAADELGTVINSLEHGGELRNGSVKIDTEAVRRMFTDRLGDADVRNNPNLRENVAMYKNKLPAQMESKNASIRGFQMLAPVTMEEVQMQGHRVLGRLNEIPVLGSRVASTLASRDLTVAEIRYRQERVLEKRRENLEKNLSGITGCDADELSMDDLISVLEESWTGERVVSEERDDRSLPLVTMTREYTETDGDSRAPDQLADDELDQQIIEDLQRSAATVEETPDSNSDLDPDPDPDPEGTTDLSDETHDQRTVSDDELDDEPETHPDPGREVPETPQTPEPEVPRRSQNGTGEEQADESEPEISIDESEYDTIEEICAAYVEAKEQAGSEHPGEEDQHTDSDTDAKRQEATI